jgi:hypothetical protein
MNDTREATLFLAALLAGLMAGGCAQGSSPPSNPGAGGSGPGNPDGGQNPPTDADDVDFDRIVDARPDKPDAAFVPLNTAACNSLRTGPFTPVMGANIFPMASVPPIPLDKPVYRVSLPARDHGFVSFMVAALGDYVFFTSTPAPLALFLIDGEVVPEQSLKTSIPECPEVKGRVAYRLTPGIHVLRLGPHAILSVDVVVAQGS